MSRKPVISVIVPAFNESARIGACVGALRRQTAGVVYEIIVSDNGSTDQTKRIARARGARVITELQKGYVYALRSGIQCSRGSIIAITDADCVPSVDWTARIHTHFHNRPDVVAVGGPFVFYDGPRWLIRLVDLCNAIHPHLLTSSLCGMNMAFRRLAYDAVGGFDTTINLQADTALGYQLAKRGDVIFDPHLVMQASGRRFGSPTRAIFESIQRRINVIALRLIGRTLIKDFTDIR